MPEHARMDDDELSTLEVQALREQITFLEAKLQRFESNQANLAPSRYQMLYRMRGDGPKKDKDDESNADSGPFFTTFMDAPEVVHGQREGARLRCSVPLDNFELYVATNPDVSFIVFRDYIKTIDPQPNAPKHHVAHYSRRARLPKPAAESIYPVASDLKEALHAILKKKREYNDILRNYERTGELAAPYLFIYHSRHEMDTIKGEMTTAAQEQLDRFLDYVVHVLGDEYGAADYFLGRKEILPEYVKYLFKPNDTLIERLDNDYTGYVAESWPSRSDEKSNRWRKHIAAGGQLDNLIPQPSPFSWKAAGSTWNFEGHFFRTSKELEFEVSPEEYPQEDTAAPEIGRSPECQRRGTDIADLRVFPLGYAPDGIVDMLRRRGDTFWQCRTRKLVSYRASNEEQFRDIVGRL